MPSNNKNQKITLHSDEPLINDEDLSKRLKALIKVIEDDVILYEQKIKSFAVYGNWGTGKTSVIRSVHQYVVSKNKSGDWSYVLPVWFDAWRYQHEGDIYPALLREVGDAIESFVPEKKNLGRVMKNMSNRILNLLYITAYATKIKFPGVELTGKDALDKSAELSAEERELKLSEQLTTFGESPYFEAIKLLRKVPTELEKEKHRGHVIIFIDDLDRCLPHVPLI